MAVTSVTVGDVLEHARKFEDALANYYKSVSRKAVKAGVVMLTDYMSRHRRRINDFLGKRSPAEMRRIRSVPLPFDPEAADCKCLDRVDIAEDDAASHVLDVAITLDECLVRLYRQAGDQAHDPEVRELFQSLLRAEERDEIQLKKIKATDYF